jgi:hypothetical protein
VILAHLGDRLLMRQTLAPEWLRVRDAADYSGISQTELFRLCLDEGNRLVKHRVDGRDGGFWSEAVS